MRRLPFAMATLAALPATAQQDPDFGSCMDIETARFERALARSQEAGDTEFEVGDVTGVDWCGTSGIVDCDRGAAPIACQHALAEEQEALRWRILATLPAPDGIAAEAAAETDGLYRALHALAHDLSAGPDCDGQTPVMAAWCEAREANRRLQSAVLAWQMARWLDAVPDGISAGWARVPPPRRPVARPAEL